MWPPKCKLYVTILIRYGGGSGIKSRQSTRLSGSKPGVQQPLHHVALACKTEVLLTILEVCSGRNSEVLKIASDVRSWDTSAIPHVSAIPPQASRLYCNPARVTRVERSSMAVKNIAMLPPSVSSSLAKVLLGIAAHQYNYELDATNIVE